jgi:hypothetical protein
MRADAILPDQAMVTTSKSLESDPTMVQGLMPLDQVRHSVAAALFGPSEPVAQVGRFQVQKLLGTGGMGVVFAATDPQLGRTVALKLLQPLVAGERARERLLREAQAMARLQHPNVVSVHEAGVYGEQVYLVMEYVEDGTLADWLRLRARGWQEVVGVLAQAGDGLAAAHAAGLVHRDFKPSNILMGAGRARISDFGLARTSAMIEDIERTTEDDGMLLAAPLTRTGALLGTPAYMAPEQIRGEPATAASDQFAFGVVLYEALVGHRPFQGTSIAVLLEAIEAGRIVEPARKLPSGLMTVIRRALRPDPARRFPDMPALLTALRGVRDVRWRPWTRVAAAAGSASALLFGSCMAIFNMSRPPPVAPCGDLSAVWDEGRRAQLVGALADSAGAEVVAAIDDYAMDLRHQLEARCEADKQGVQWTDTCLADRRSALADLVKVLAEAPVALHPAARAAVDMLPALADCAAPPKYTALVSEAAPEIRTMVWEHRLGFAPMFQPRAATRPLPELQPFKAFNPQEITQATQDRRLALEMNFAMAVQELHRPAERETTTAKDLLNTMLGARSVTRYDPLPALRQTGEEATGAGYADLAARAWVLAAELLEARPHSERDRKQVLAEAEQALGRLPEAHPLRRLLERDLAYLQLTHARHTTGAGVCGGGGADFATCDALFSATKSLAAVAAKDTATPADHELLARAHEYAGDARAAAAARASTGAVALDERSLGYLDFSAGVTVPDGPTPEESIRCDLEGTNCEIDRAFMQGLHNDPEALFAGARHMAAVTNGKYRGHKLYGIRPGNPIKALGFKNGDLITAVDGVTVDEGTVMAQFKALLVRGEGTVTFERKGALTTRRITIR